MTKYPKIQGLFKRYTEGKDKNKFIIGEYSLPEFKLLKDITWVWTEKIDGTNIRIKFYKRDEFIMEFAGRTDKAEIPNHLLERLQKTFAIKKLKEVFESSSEQEFLDICLYGEGYGYKIQNGCKYFAGKKLVDFILFDIKIGNTWLKREDAEKIANQLGIKIVPIIGEGTIDEGIRLISTQGLYSTFGNQDFLAEGIVIKPKIDLLDRRGRRIISKIKHKDFRNE